MQRGRSLTLILLLQLCLGQRFYERMPEPSPAGLEYGITALDAPAGYDYVYAIETDTEGHLVHRQANNCIWVCPNTDCR